MTKAEREEYKKKKKLYKKLGAEKFQGIVFQVESIKFKILKKLCPNYIKYYDKWCDFREKRVLKKATTDLEKEKIKENTKFLKMEMRREFNQKRMYNLSFLFRSKKRKGIAHTIKENEESTTKLCN